MIRAKVLQRTRPWILSRQGLLYSLPAPACLAPAMLQQLRPMFKHTSTECLERQFAHRSSHDMASPAVQNGQTLQRSVTPRAELCLFLVCMAMETQFAQSTWSSCYSVARAWNPNGEAADRSKRLRRTHARRCGHTRAHMRLWESAPALVDGLAAGRSWRLLGSGVRSWDRSAAHLGGDGLRIQRWSGDQAKGSRLARILLFYMVWWYIVLFYTVWWYLRALCCSTWCGGTM